MRCSAAPSRRRATTSQLFVLLGVRAAAGPRWPHGDFFTSTRTSTSVSSHERDVVEREIEQVRRGIQGAQVAVQPQRVDARHTWRRDNTPGKRAARVVADLADIALEAARGYADSGRSARLPATSSATARS